VEKEAKISLSLGCFFSLGLPYKTHYVPGCLNIDGDDTWTSSFKPAYVTPKYLCYQSNSDLSDKSLLFWSSDYIVLIQTKLLYSASLLTFVGHWTGKQCTRTV